MISERVCRAHTKTVVSGDCRWAGGLTLATVQLSSWMRAMGGGGWWF